MAADAGKIIQLELTFKVTPSGTRTTFANFETEYIQIPPPSVALTSSAISGEPEVNFELTAEVTAVGVTNPSISYEWYAVPPGQTLSTTAHRISGASGARYTPGQTDVGRLIAVIGRFFDGIGNPHTTTSSTVIPVRSSAVIVAPRGFYINETLQVNTATMNLRGLARFVDVHVPVDLCGREWSHCGQRGKHFQYAVVRAHYYRQWPIHAGQNYLYGDSRQR